MSKFRQELNNWIMRFHTVVTSIPTVYRFQWDVCGNLCKHTITIAATHTHIFSHTSFGDPLIMKVAFLSILTWNLVMLLWILLFKRTWHGWNVWKWFVLENMCPEVRRRLASSGLHGPIWFLTKYVSSYRAIVVPTGPGEVRMDLESVLKCRIHRSLWIRQ